MDKQDNQNQIINKEDAPDFSEADLVELNNFISNENTNISATTASNFLTLYLEGRSIEQIHKRFPQWPKGVLLKARYVYKWDKARDDYVEMMTKEIAGRAAKIKAEVVHYLFDSLAVTHKEFTREMEIYLQNPCAKNLPRNRIKGLKEYRETIKTLGEALNIGQPAKPEGVSIVPSVAVQVNAAEGSTVKITSGEREDVLRVLAGETDDKPSS